MLFNKVMDFLTNNDKMMSQWKQVSLTVEQVDSIFELLQKEILQHSDVKEGLNLLAKSIATEQFVKKMNLEDFTNALTTGRSVLITEVLNLDISNEEKT